MNHMVEVDTVVLRQITNRTSEQHYVNKCNATMTAIYLSRTLENQHKPISMNNCSNIVHTKKLYHMPFHERAPLTSEQYEVS